MLECHKFHEFIQGGWPGLEKVGIFHLQKYPPHNIMHFPEQTQTFDGLQSQKVLSNFFRWQNFFINKLLWKQTPTANED